MKKVLVLLLTFLMIFSLFSCKSNEEVKMVSGIEVPSFEIYVCGNKVTNEDLKDLNLYEVTSNTLNSKGTEHSNTYVGFKVSDILNYLNISGTFNKAKITCTDGYEYEFEGDLFSDLNLIAISKDGEMFKNGPFFAPCISDVQGDFAKDFLKIEIDGIENKVDENLNNEEETEIIFPQDPLVEDKTDKITFSDYSFKINGNEITNTDLEGLKIYRITVTTRNSKDKVSQNKYSGYVLRDVLDKLGVSNSTVKAIASDGYESELSEEMINSDLTLVAIEKDKEVGENGTIWIAPCNENTTGSYVKGVVEIVTE